MNVIQEFRVQVGLSQSEFARLTHVPVRTIRAWEQGYRKPIDYVPYLIGELLVHKHLMKKSEMERILDGNKVDNGNI